MEIKTKYGIGDVVKFKYPRNSENPSIASGKVVRMELTIGTSGRPVVKYWVYGDVPGYLCVREQYLI